MTAWTLPGTGRITSPYGPRALAGAIGPFHYGVDLATKRGPVSAATAGVVRTIWQTAAGAWVLDIRHPDEGGHQIRTRYIHMDRDDIAVRVGQAVAAGQRVGLSGASGTSAAHLHYEVMVDGANVDPGPFMAARGVQLGVEQVNAPITTPGAVTTAPTVTTPAPLTPTSQEDDMRFLFQADLQVSGAWYLCDYARGTRWRVRNGEQLDLLRTDPTVRGLNGPQPMYFLDGLAEIGA